MTALLIGLLVSATTEQMGSLEVEAPAGSTRNGNTFVTPHTAWVFDPETRTTNPASWAADTMRASLSKLKKPFSTPVTHQPLPSGLEAWTVAGSGFDDQGEIVCILVLGVHDAQTGRAAMTRFLADSQEAFDAGRKVLGRAAKFLAFTGPPPPPIVAQPPAPPAAPQLPGIPDGKYTCSRLSYTIGRRGSLEPSFRLSYIDNAVSVLVFREDRYEAPEVSEGGTVRRGDAQLTFIGGPLDGWVAATGRNSTGPFLRVRSSNRLAPGTEAKVGDDICYGKK